jgi:3-methylfumaryl-CoA hydratase
VYRDIPTVPGGAVEGELASIDANWSQLFYPDPILLFRFSALTYNSHRIHYDRDYATREELYPGLVVHAPLLVTLLLNLALHESPKTAISSFQFRAVRPTFDIDTVHLRGRAEGKAVSLWSADHQNYVGMKVSAVFGDHS